MSNCIRPKVFLFNRVNQLEPLCLKKSQQYQLRIQKEINLAKLKLLDEEPEIGYKMKPPIRSSRAFGLGVTARKHFSLCEIKEISSSENSRKKLFSDKISLIRNFYALKKTIKKAHEITKHNSVETITKEEYTPIRSELYTKTVYHTARKIRKVMPQSFSKIMSDRSKNTIKIELPQILNQNCICIQTDEINGDII